MSGRKSAGHADASSHVPERYATGGPQYTSATECAVCTAAVVYTPEDVSLLVGLVAHEDLGRLQDGHGRCLVHGIDLSGCLVCGVLA